MGISKQLNRGYGHLWKSNDTPTDDEIVVHDVAYLESLHHALDARDMPHFSFLKENVVCEDTNHYLEGLTLPFFLSKEEDVINDASS